MTLALTLAMLALVPDAPRADVERLAQLELVLRLQCGTTARAISP